MGVSQLRNNSDAKWEYGMMLDCELNFCLSPHADNGRVFIHQEHWDGAPDFSVLPKVNGHICRWVRRSLEWSDYHGDRFGEW